MQEPERRSVSNRPLVLQRNGEDDVERTNILLAAWLRASK